MTEELCLMALNIDEKFKEKLAFAFKNNMRNLKNFHQSTWKSPNWDLDVILLSKVEMYDLKIYSGSYLPWQRKIMKYWRRNWLVVTKLTWGIWQIVTRALENLNNLQFNGLFSSNFWAIKVQWSIIWWHWRLMQNLTEKLICAF